MTALRFIVSTVLDLYILTFVMRFILQWVHVTSLNPFWQFVLKVTNPIVLPLRRVIPGWRGLELVSPLFVIVLEVIAVIVLYRFAGYPVPGPAAVFYFALLRAVLAVLHLYVIALLIYVLLSWINPDVSNPLTRVLAGLCEPLLRPVRRILPTIGGFDLSPLILLIALQALAMTIPLPAYLA